MRLPNIVRKLILRGRDSRGWFSLEGWATAPTEETPTIISKRAQHYGFVSEPPNGTQVISLAINNGPTNQVSVAEYPSDEPEIDEDEVLLWCKSGQRILLKKNGDVIVLPKAGQNVLLGVETAGEKVVTEAALNAKLNSLQSWLNSHTHPSPSGPTSAPTVPLVGLSVNGSPNVKAKGP